MKRRNCPACGSLDLGDRWCNGRRLMQYCRDDDCGWKGDPRTPEQRRISNHKELRVDDFCGWDFVVFDRFGHEMVISRTFTGRASALKELKRDLARGKDDKDGGPYTGILFNTPAVVKLEGERFTT